MIFDTHAHYDDERFDEDRDTLLTELHKNGISYILEASASIESLETTIALSQKYDFIYAALGVHPSDIDKMDEGMIDKIRELAKNSKVVAIGEIGLDYYYDDSPREIQRYWFERQIVLARELKLPIIIHDRDAHEDIVNLVKKTHAKEVGGIFHCFSGSAQMAADMIKHNFYISIAGTVTFKNAKKVVEVVKTVPLDKLLIETDCPYLAPEPYRGKRNNSGNLTYIISKIAEIRGISGEEVARTTLDNAKKLFGIT